MERKRIVVMGFMGYIPIAGVIWQHLHYIVGLQRLGHEVYYIEDSGRYPYDPERGLVDDKFDYAVRVLGRLAEEFGFAGRWGYCARFLPELPTAGLSLGKIRELYRTADAIVNVCGAQELHDDLLASERLIYVESDPGLEQIKVDQGDAITREMLQRQHALFSFGEHVGTENFHVPTHGLPWQPTRQPVVIDFWETDDAPPGAAVFTSIANWNTSDLKDIEWRGDKYVWSKSLEFLRFIAAPRQSNETFELATDIKDEATRAQFLENGWRFHSPGALSIRWDLYRDYIRQSKGEFTVAKDQYVRLRTGWFSDRSACYLAAGRPVITQQTGFTDFYGREGKGLFAFTTLEEITEAVRAINADYAQHSRAAREIAREVFAAEKVLATLLERAGI